MKTVYIVSLEPLENRYTKQWHSHIPLDLEAYAKSKNIDVTIIQIDGETIPECTLPGAFLDFGATNVWKSSQLIQIAKLFNEGKIQPNSVFFYTDFWNPSVIQLKYMSELLKIPVKIVGISHAGSYDSQDFLGRLIGNKPWIRDAEKSMFECFDHLCFATDFHIQMFTDVLFSVAPSDWLDNQFKSKKIVRSGFPMSYMPEVLEPFKNQPKKDQIVFPHRLAPEKQLNIFLALAKEMPEYEWVVCQDKKLTKDEYHQILAESKIVFSASLQETLGISQGIDGPLSYAIPLSPNRLSYAEIFRDYQEFLYESEWTESWASYIKHKDKLISKVRNVMNNYDIYKELTQDYCEKTLPKYIEPTIMYDMILS